MTFEDSKQPFDPNDNAPVPDVGDRIEFYQDYAKKSGMVEIVFGSLAEDWGDLGEAAWAMHDVNDAAGKKGHWYAFVGGDDGDDYVIASYEAIS